MNNLYILKPKGFIDSQNGSDLRVQICSLLAEKAMDFLIDFQEVEFMDSSGFGALVSALKRVREHGRQIFLCSLNSQLRLVLELTNMDRVFTIFPSSHECFTFVAERSAES
jgi:anti-anti-sigma factor